MAYYNVKHFSSEFVSHFSINYSGADRLFFTDFTEFENLLHLSSMQFRLCF